MAEPAVLTTADSSSPSSSTLTGVLLVVFCTLLAIGVFIIVFIVYLRWNGLSLSLSCIMLFTKSSIDVGFCVKDPELPLGRYDM